MLVGANMSGCEKLPLLVIGKSASPRCFKKANIPLEYTANKKAWMRCKFLGHFNVFNHRLADIFGNWLKKWDEKLVAEGRRILLYVDNVSSHSTNVDLRNITVQYFPPNTTANSQVNVQPLNHPSEEGGQPLDLIFLAYGPERYWQLEVPL